MSKYWDNPWVIMARWSTM